MNLTAFVLVVAIFLTSCGADSRKPRGVTDRTPQEMTDPPQLYIDKGVCPGEGCRYVGTLKIMKTTFAYARPDQGSRRWFQFMAGDDAIPLTGEVHSFPGRFVVRKARGKYKPGDVLWLYTYLGEGHFKIWFGGKMYPEAMSFSPYGSAKGCEGSPHCWGDLVQELKTTWWVKIKDKYGLTGWTKRENLGGGFGS
jgi:hypothetical protein